MALAMVIGALTPLSVAHADPVDPNSDVIIETTPDDANTETPSDDEIIEDAADADAVEPITEGSTVTDADVEAADPAPDDTADSTADRDPAPASNTETTEIQTDETATPASETDAVDQDAADPAASAQNAEVLADQEAASEVAAVAPLSVDTAAVSGLKSMRLRKANGAWVTVTPQMQANALIVINTIRAANWSGVSAKDKDRLIVIALMTMAQESTFYTHPRAHIPDRNQDVGPFQQRSKVGWYADGRTQAENVRILNNIPYATRTFIEGHRVPRYVSGGAGPRGYIIPGVFQMKGSKNWRTDAMWRVAANVQRPASQYRYHYEYWRPVVQSMVKALNGYSSGPDGVYTTAGSRTVNGRKWRTTCEDYSTTIVRCTATIWATTVTRVNGRFVQKNGWQFNNLTYLPSSRSQWRGNPLATTGTFTSGGRQWKTSCGDSWTGPNGCRSFVMTDVIEAYKDSGGNRKFRDARKWVFNNIVRFSG